MDTRRTRRGRRAGAIVAAAAATAAILGVLFLPAGGAARAQTAPANTSAPTVSGTAVKGQTLTAGTGSWTGTQPITFTYQWLRCDSAGANCTSIASATATTYTLASDTVGSRIRVQVTGTNADGTAVALSEATAVVAGDVPVNTAEPRTSGSAVEGQTLSTDTGSWTGAQPITFAHQWVRCGTDGGAPDGGNCQFVPGATKSTYVVDDDDVGRRLRVRVTATNSAGVQTAASNATPVVLVKASTTAPVNTSRPTISGSVVQGTTLTAGPGTWTGAQPLTFTFQWLRCDDRGGNCGTISGATRQTFTPGQNEVNRRLRVNVTARNAKGSATAQSDASSAVRASGPAGIVTLPNGERSIPVTSVPADQRLVVDRVEFSPNPVRSRTAQFTVRVKVKDTRGFVVRDALVFLRSTPLVTRATADQRTGTDGWLTITLQPEPDFPALRPSYNVQFFVKAFRAGDPVLAGVAGTRLVQAGLAR